MSVRASDDGMTCDQLRSAIERERARLLTAVDAMGDRADATAVTEEGWTAKDVLAHLIHWATQAAFGLGVDVQPPAYMVAERMRRKAAGLSDAMPTGDESNALAVAYFREIPLVDVRAQFEQLVDAIVERLTERTDAELNATDAVPWAPGRPLWHFVAGDTCAHWPLHAEMIERANP